MIPAERLLHAARARGVVVRLNERGALTAAADDESGEVPASIVSALRESKPQLVDWLRFGRERQDRRAWVEAWESGPLAHAVAAVALACRGPLPEAFHAAYPRLYAALARALEIYVTDGRSIELERIADKADALIAGLEDAIR